MSTARREEGLQRHTPQMVIVMHEALNCACRTRSAHIGVEHLWVGLLSTSEGVALRVLSALDVDVAALRETISAGIPTGEHGPDPGEPFTAESFIQGLQARDRTRLSDDARAVLARAAAQTDAHVDTGHLLLGLLAHDPDALAESGVTEQQVRAETARLLAEFLRGRPANVDAGKADELIAAPRVSVPADIRALDEKIADTRRAKEAAIDAEEFETAGRIRDHEKQLLSQRAERVRDWAAGIDVLALAEEVEALRAEVDRLRTHRHDNNADENRT